MLKKRQTALVASLIFAIAMGSSGQVFASQPSPFLPVIGDASGGLPPTNESMDNPELTLPPPIPSLPCAGGADLLNAATAATNSVINVVNREANKVGSEMRAKRSCIENINALISLSMPTFPSLSGIIGKIASAIINAMINKACAAVTGAINGAVNAINAEIQGVKDQVMQPINSVRNEYQSKIGPSNPTQPVWVNPEVVDVTIPTPVPTSPQFLKNGGTGAPSQSAGRQAVPPPKPPASAEPTGWKGISCKIFGGC